MKVAIVGSRDWRDAGFITRAMDRFRAIHGVDLVVSGAAQGADTIGERWAFDLGIPRLIHPAKWGEGPQTRTRSDGQTYDPAAGITRNAYIVRDSDVVMAFVTDWRTSRGTRNTVDTANREGRPTFMYDKASTRWYLNPPAHALVEAGRLARAIAQEGT